MTAEVCPPSLFLSVPADGEQAGFEPILFNLGEFARLLRGCGLTVSVGQTRACAEGLTLIDLADRRQVLETARTLLVSKRRDLALFNDLFDRFWNAEQPVSRRRPLPPSKPKPRLDVAGWAQMRGAGQNLEERDVVDRSSAWSPDETLRRRSFADLTDQELLDVRRLVRDFRWNIAQRRTRRLLAANRGRPCPRRTLRAAARTGGVPVRLHYRRPKIRPRPLVVLADVSGSMDRVSRILLHFLYGVVHGSRDAQVFTFGTRVTCITPELRVRHVDRAIDDAAKRVVDSSGGTRTGECLRAFHRHWGGRVLRRGAVVLMLSDGCDRGDSALLQTQIRHLALRCHRLIWLHPFAGTTEFSPRTGGLAAALPFVDDFLPVRHLEHLHQLAVYLRGLPARPRGAATSVARGAQPTMEEAT